MALTPCFMVPEAGVEPARAQGPGDFESPASASSATPAGVSIAYGTRGGTDTATRRFMRGGESA